MALMRHFTNGKRHTAPQRVDRSNTATKRDGGRRLPVVGIAERRVRP
jgi:hypothetical protein